MKGENVKLLHDELERSGYRIPSDEKEKKYFGVGTRSAVMEFQKKHGLRANGEVDKTTAAEMKRLLGARPISPKPSKPGDKPATDEFRVSGMVRDADGKPIPRVTVRAFDRDLRHEQLLGEAHTDTQGKYLINYSEEQFRKREKGSADLVVKAFAVDGSPLVASAVLFNAPPHAEVDLTIPGEVWQPPTLFEKIRLELEPLLEGLKAGELEEDKRHQDLSFLSGETGFDKKVLARFVLAHRLAQHAIQPEFWFALLGGSFFQFNENQSLREQLAAILDSLSSLNAASVRKALTRAFNQKEIPEAFREKVDDWVEAFLDFVASWSVSPSDEPTFVKMALEHAGIKNSKKQEKFAHLFNEYKALTPKLLDELKKDDSFSKAEIDDLRTSFRLAELTQSNFSVVKMLKERFGIGKPEKIRLLAKKSQEEWVELVSKAYAAGSIKVPFEVSNIAGQIKLPEAEVYGKMLERQFRKAFPTTAFAGGLGRAINNGGTKGLKRSHDLRRLLDKHEEFEFLTTPIDEFLKTKLSQDLAELAKDEQFKLELKAVQRVFKLATNFEATDKLLADNLHSAQKIYRMGESEFVRNYGNKPGFDLENARLVWRRAADTHAAVLTIVGDLESLEARGMPIALRNGNEAVSNFPNWNNLFKTGDLCQCEHCRSVLGPAAYFADLVMFLKDRKAKDDVQSVKDILFGRRPDLGFLELNCDNALTPLPYVDVVCEVLEDVVDSSGENDLELPGFTGMPAAPAAAKAAVAAAFSAKNISLGADFSLSPVNPSDPDRWVVHGDDVTYLLKKKPPSLNFFAEILRNTKASDAELRAYPQYVNPKAYEKLRLAKYPQALPLDLFTEGDAKRLDQRARSFALPFDLSAEEVRAAFQKCNLQRWDLMGTLRGQAAPNNPADGEIAAEYFGISTDPPASFDEKRLILVADATDAGQKAVWREVGNANWWLDTVGNFKNFNVKIFLQKTGLEYNELLTLFDLKFINPAADIIVHHHDTSCDTDKKVIQFLDATYLDRLDRIHRFLRMWRKLRGWKMWELDLVIRNPRIGNGALDELFLINLFYLCEVKNKLGGKTTVEQVCALFNNLSTEAHFTKLYEKKGDALYQSLFLNKRLIQPLDPAFEIDPATNEIKPIIDPNTGLPDKLLDHQSVVLAALGIREADLVLLKGLTKASDSTSYITDDLTLTNLSFLWRHAWLAKQLKFKAEEWKILLKILPEAIPNFPSLNNAKDFLEKKYHIKAANFSQAEVDEILLKIFHRNMFDFACPKAAWEFLKEVEHIRNTGFNSDELDWLLTADRSAKAAPKEADAARFLATLRKELQAIQAEYDPVQYDFLTPPTDVDRLIALLTSLLQKLNRDEVATQFFITTLRDEVSLEKKVAGLPANFDFPAAIKNAIRIRYDKPAATLRFTGLMTAAERTTLLAVTGVAAYQEAIDEFFNTPRLALKFFEPMFTTPLANLPAAVDFKTLPDPALALKISYDAEQRLLRFVGIMSKDEKAALDGLSADAAYRNAVNSLTTQPGAIAPPDDRIWMLDAYLQFPLRDLNVPANDHLKDNLATAATKALAYLSKTLSEGIVVQEVSAQLGLTAALTRRLLTNYALQLRPAPAPKESLLKYLTDSFADTGSVVDYATLKTTLDGWYWANRVAAIWKKWKITLAELEKIISLTAGAQLLDFQSLPLDDTGAIPSMDRFLRTSRLLRLRDSLPETKITLLEVLIKLNNGVYTAEAASNPPTTSQQLFAGDVERLNEAWLAADVVGLTASLDFAYPADYLLAESWERLRRAFYFLDNLNAGADTVKTFAAAGMSDTHAKTLKELLRSKFGTETWLTLSAEIQDALRERKRDALAAYLLTQPKPPDAPSGKWENTNDLYAYYLLDVEMNSCQLTSRLVQGSGSVQLFVQRCFMGLEPYVAVNADGDDGDSAWRWWKWMSKYRVWEANRKVFLWPENWIEPELKKDRSQFFKDLENELLQNEINQYTVETAFLNYLEKLDGVAQLEIAGFYQEDDGDNTIVHVFGRTAGAEPHLYYYRRYDYCQWTPWEKVELDIQGDYLIPAVVSKRLLLFWPVFTEVPDEEGNSRFPKTPHADQENVVLEKAKKKLRLQIAVSEYRQGKWTPKRVSKDYEESFQYDVVIVRKHYSFFPIDMGDLSKDFIIRYNGFSVSENGKTVADFNGAFVISGSKGMPEKITLPADFISSPTDWHGKTLPPDFINVIRPESDSTGSYPIYMKWKELGANPLETRGDYPEDDFTLDNFLMNQSDSLRYNRVLMNTPGYFTMSPAWLLSYFDKLWFKYWLDKLRRVLVPVGVFMGNYVYEVCIKSFVPLGTWMPFFYHDKKRTFFVLPMLQKDNGNSIRPIVDSSRRNYYPEIKKAFSQFEIYLEGQVQTFLDSTEFSNLLSSLQPDQRTHMEIFLQQQLDEETPPPYTNEELKNLVRKWMMRYLRYFLGAISYRFFESRKFHFKNFYHPFVYDFSKLLYNPLKGIPALMRRETQLKNSGFSFRQTYQPTNSWVVEDISLTFSLLDIKDIASFASKLKQPSDSVSSYLKGKLSAATRQALANYQGPGSNPVLLQTNLVNDLNIIIRNETVFDVQRFAGVTLRLGTQELLAQHPQGDDLIRLNRLLLEDAYPQEMSRNEGSHPKEIVDFTPDGAYSPYNWELFFHAPLLIANQLSKNQRFEEARDWYHFIFNPIGVESTMLGGSPMSKYWITKAFFETTGPQYIQQRIDNILRMLAGDTSVPGYSEQAKEDLEAQVQDWRTNPFEPHRIANYRTVAYQKTVVMRYLDNLIEWGDYLFRQDGMESINEATQLYILAADILGPRPKRIPPQAKPPVESFNELEYKFEQGLNRFGNPIVEVENLIPVMPGTGQNDGDTGPLPILYFCIPQNDKMLSYWDTVADRLYKIRHCMNIEGVVRQLALFEPPIDPGALVKAVAAGVDISSALADLNSPLSLYRFNILLQKANEVCNDVKALGGALLSALEKKDAEALSLLRQSQEIRVLEAVKAMREKQIEEAKENLEGLKRSKAIVEVRRNYYRDIEKLIAQEQLYLDKMRKAHNFQEAAQGVKLAASIISILPAIDLGASGFGGSPVAKFKIGGLELGQAADLAAEVLFFLSLMASNDSAMASSIASFERRWEDWKLQEKLADKELDQIDKQIAAGELRIAIAEKELENHVLQIENAKAIDEFMRSKYTNQELYQWQVGQISGVYFQSYKLAYDLAKRAERCFRFELGLQDSSYIQFGYWDSLKRGLLSGEKLQYDLRRLETAYLEQNRREFELTKHISLALLDPLALVRLRETGRCFFRLPEEIFDLDYPGHYFRRIKSVSITLPCVVGPYTTISCTLRLLKNRIRINTANGASGYPRNTDDQGLPADDDRFIENNIPVKVIAASNAQNDSGVFELSFRDERYLPFEGAGAVSEWSLELFNDSNADFGKPLRQFDYSTISDAILHIKYTAREDAGAFKNGAVAHLRDYFSQDGATPSLRMFNLRQEFPTQWHRFLNPTNPANGNIFELEMSTNLFPFRDKGKKLKANKIWLLARCMDSGNYSVIMTPPLPPPPPPPDPDPNMMTLSAVNQYGGLHFSQKDVGIEIVPTDPPVKWQVKMTRPGGGNLQKDPVKQIMEVEDLLLVLGYEWEES
jgi:hypothetical protein